MGTHINAYYSEVEAAKTELNSAENKLAAAEAALRAHPDYREPKSDKPAKKAVAEPKASKKK